MSIETITYVGGCGRLGLPLAAWSASRGYGVYCADVNEHMVEAVNKAEVITVEPRVADLVRLGREDKRLVATTDTEEAVRQSDAAFVIVPTPSMPEGEFSLGHILPACWDVGKGMREEDARCRIVVIASTVNPGDTGGLIKKELEEASGKVAGRDFQLFYSPEFVAQGSIVRDFADPDFILIGCDDPEVYEDLAEYYIAVTSGQGDGGRYIPISTMTLVEAELAKISLNAYLVLKTSFANMIAWMCQGIPGADADLILTALGHDERIGPKFFRPGLRASGPCLPRDSRALVCAGEKCGADASLAKAAFLFSRVQDVRLRVLVDELMRECNSSKVGVLGLTYKPGVDIVEESPGVQLVRDLARWHHADVQACDPCAPMVEGITRNDLKGVVAHADVLVLTTPWPSFTVLNMFDLRKKVVLDCWGFLAAGKLNCKKYVRLGRGM